MQNKAYAIIELTSGLTSGLTYEVHTLWYQVQHTMPAKVVGVVISGDGETIGEIYSNMTIVTLAPGYEMHVDQMAVEIAQAIAEQNPPDID